LGLGFMQYIQDYDEKVPCGQGNVWASTDNFGQGWAGQVYPYVKSIGVFACPDDTSVPATAGYSINSYALNANFGGLDTTVGWNSYYGTASTSTFVSPSTTILLFEVGGNEWKSSSPTTEADSEASFGICNFNPYDTYAYQNDVTFMQSSTDLHGCYYTNWGTPDSGTTAGIVAMTVNGLRHSAGSNLLCADGHVKWLTPNKVCIGVTTSLAAQLGGALVTAVSAANLGSYTVTTNYQ